MSSGDLYYLSPPPDQTEPFYWEVSTLFCSIKGLTKIIKYHQICYTKLPQRCSQHFQICSNSKYTKMSFPFFKRKYHTRFSPSNLLLILQAAILGCAFVALFLGSLGVLIIICHAYHRYQSDTLTRPGTISSHFLQDPDISKKNPGRGERSSCTTPL